MVDSESAWANAAKAGRLVARQLNFKDWLAIAHGLHAMRGHLREETGVSHDASPVFSKAMAEFARQHKWAARFMGDSKSSFRSAAYALVDNEAAVAEWRSTLSEGDRLRWRHPEVVMREWRRATTGAAGSNERPSLKGQAAALRKENSALKREIRDLKAALAKADPRRRLIGSERPKGRTAADATDERTRPENLRRTRPLSLTKGR